MNSSLATKVDDLCRTYREHQLSLRELADQIAFHADAFEQLRYEQVREGRRLASALRIQADYADEGCEYEAEVQRILTSIELWLAQIPK